MLSGLFDRFPSLTIILGHMGEALPLYLWRIDSRFKISEPKVSLRQMPSAYIRRNIAVTTAGVFAPEPLRCAIDAMGLDRVLSRSTIRSRTATRPPGSSRRHH